MRDAPHPLFRGLWVPLVTPFTPTGAVDHAALAALVQRLAPSGVAGFVVAGSTGEAGALSDDEQLACLATVQAHAQGLPLLVGVAGHHLGHALAWVRRLAALPTPPAGLLVSAPMYLRPAQAGLQHWFEAIANASALPLVLYDIPERTGAVISTCTLLALAAHPRIVAVKDCANDLAKTLALVHHGRLAVLAGNDLQMFATMAQGGAGAIAASAHVHTGVFVRMLRALEQGNLAAARADWQHLVPLVQALFAEPNPAPVKALLARLGLIGPGLRAPMVAASAGLVQRLVGLHDSPQAGLERAG